MSSVDSGRWKLVSSPSVTRKLNPGRMKSRVSPDQGRSEPEPATVSSTRTTVVPTATTRLPRARQAFSASAVLAGSDLLRRAYETAVEQQYRFYSYGDAMLVR